MLNRVLGWLHHPNVEQVTRLPFAVMLVVLSTTLFSYPGRMENRLLDALLYTRPLWTAESVRLVTIDDQDYKEQFAEHSPLQVEKLEETLARLQPVERG